LNEVVQLSKGAELIGLSLMTNFFDNVVQLTQSLKKHSGVPIVWGGIHPTLRPEECLNYTDMVCIGEGEETLAELVRKMNSGEDFRNVQGMWFKDNERIVKNELRPLIQDLDSIPFPDYDCENHYILCDGSVRRMDKDLLVRYTDGEYMTIATRGCPFQCTYCCNNALNEMYPSQKLVRRRSTSNLIRELMVVTSRLPFMNCIKFDDDAFFTYPEQEISDFCVQYKKDIGLPLVVSGATPTTLTRQKLSLLVDAGLRELRMGIQTASERTKKLYKRSHSNEQVEQAVRIINEFKEHIRLPQYDIIVDNPWETENDLIETLMFMSRLPTPYRIAHFALTFYPGTELYEKAKDDGIITDDLKDVYRKYYHDSKRTYLNGLFFLLSEYYTRRDRRISPAMMSLLTNRKLRQSGLAWLLCIILKFWSDPLSVTRRVFDLLHKRCLNYSPQRH